MPWLSPYILDNGLAKLKAQQDESRRLDFCSAEPDTYAKATSTMTLGNKTGLAIGDPEDRDQVGKQPGRKVIVGAFTDGTATKTGDVQYWAITDPGNSRLLATGTLPAKMSLTEDFVLTLAAFDIGIPNCQ